ncbi:LOW QUALITY PROTEIN: hypothetical protein QTO34_014995 [Cnephaeus nilssonii]|uniref:Uncharacterized protein n=1 Tax=Cnephaeus nilssonii TaxID=3371016 RepID=A0AA40HA61_CNENI|nr:LOW QUALITY PROTEIN: hypothetical protein QTO34_014995 [Eptesicus nilssonii]
MFRFSFRRDVYSPHNLRRGGSLLPVGLTWDDCQQLLQVLFTTEERERILNEAQKLVPGADRNSTTNQAQIDTSFSLTRPEWDFNMAEGKERLWVYHQTLMGGLRMAARKPTNLAKVGNVQQEKDESPAAFLERVIEAFRTYTPMDPEAPESKAAVVMAFVNQSAADIRRKLQKVDRLGEKNLQDLLIVAEKVYNNQELPGDKQAHAVAAASSKQTRDLAKILLATTTTLPRNRTAVSADSPATRRTGTSRGGRRKLQKDQCAYCREIGHWKQECLKRASKKGGEANRVKVLELDELNPLPEPRVTLRVEGTPIGFLVDTGAQHSVLRTPQGKLANKKSWVQGATGMSQYSWTTRRTVDLGMGRVSHSFMVILECPYPLLGRDLLTKIGAQITFRQGGPQVTDGEGHPIQVLTMRLEDEYQLHQKASPVEDSMDEWLQKFPTAWAETGGVGLAAHRALVLGDLKPGEGPSQIVLHASGSPEGNSAKHSETEGIGVLVPCQSAWNTPLLLVKEPHMNDYQPVQDLREVNKRVMDIHPMVPNPYTLLSSLAPSHVWYTVLDLKDAFFSLPLAPHSQPLFAFEWHDLEEGYSGQLTWTRLPQGFKNSPTIFDEALHEDLGEYRRTHPNLTLLQYVDDILIAADTAEDCKQGTRDLLASLGALGYRASAKKAQICRERVSYLGYILEGGQRRLSDARKETMLKIPTPTSRREVREFLGSAGYCRLWIPGFAEIARPLYEATKEGKAFEWTEREETAFKQLKKALLNAPALGLPDIEALPSLHEHKGIEKGVLTQTLGPWSRPVAYLSKKLDPVAAGWPPCLRIIVATALLVKDADKLTLGQEVWITTPHAIEGVLKQPPDRWMSNTRMTHYQSLLLNPPRVRFHPSAALNPATLLPDPNLDAPLHDCAGILEQVHGLRKD